MTSSQEAKESKVPEEEAPDPAELNREMREIQTDSAQLTEIE